MTAMFGGQTCLTSFPMEPRPARTVRPGPMQYDEGRVVAILHDLYDAADRAGPFRTAEHEIPWDAAYVARMSEAWGIPIHKGRSNTVRRGGALYMDANRSPPQYYIRIHQNRRGHIEHEIAHYIRQERGDAWPRGRTDKHQEEIVAESVAYVVHKLAGHHKVASAEYVHKFAEYGGDPRHMIPEVARRVRAFMARGIMPEAVK